MQWRAVTPTTVIKTQVFNKLHHFRVNILSENSDLVYRRLKLLQPILPVSYLLFAFDWWLLDYIIFLHPPHIIFIGKLCRKVIFDFFFLKFGNILHPMWSEQR